jgi:hypothetical protein
VIEHARRNLRAWVPDVKRALPVIGVAACAHEQSVAIGPREVGTETSDAGEDDRGDFKKRLADYEMRLLVDGANTAVTVVEGVVTEQQGSIARNGRVCGRAPAART